MQNLILGDYPPIPECFSHLITSDADFSQKVRSRLNQQRYLPDNGDESEPVSPVSPHPENGVDQHKSSKNVDENGALDSVSEKFHPEENCEGSSLQGPFQKLNASLGKLQREMKDLRNLDMSLFYQLIALNETIQDFKLNNVDRFSETDSEYSLGTASYMGSMSSLNEESDWPPEEAAYLNSPQLDGDETLLAHDQKSTSELLSQINNLALRADQDFSDV